MLSEVEARAKILESVSRGATQNVPLADAWQRFAAERVLATVPLPSFDNSAMDGYAVRAADTLGAAPLPVSGEQPAGPDRHLTLEPGHAIRIFTGAPLPLGADAVIMQEDVETADEGKRIICREPVSEGEFVRRAGSDLCIGQMLVETGERLTAGRLAVLASQGLSEVAVTILPRVAVVTTGDELVAAGQPLLKGQIYNSNHALLTSLVRDLGIHDSTTQHLADELDSTVEALCRLMENHEIVLLSGGVSVGERDFIKPALQALGIKPEFWRVKIQPGKPLLFVTYRSSGHTCHVFGLPGNPVSSFVTFQLFVRPAFLKLMGARESEWPLRKVRATLSQSVTQKGDRPHYLRGRYEDGKFFTQGLQQSHALFGLSQANALFRLEPASSQEAGSEVEVLLY